MTKDEYGDFVLRYKGCGACFPLYHTLSRFEKMWFTAIQKDVEELEKENAELKARLFCTKETCDNCGFVKCGNFQRQRKSEPCSVYISYKDRITKLKLQLIKAKKIIKGLLELGSIGDGDYTYVAEAEQFLKEVDK